MEEYERNESGRTITLEQFFIECSIRLGIPYKTFKENTYIIDLFDLLDAKKRVEAEDWLMDLNVKVISQTTSEEAFRKFVASLQKQSGIVSEQPKFDKAGFERLKMRLKAGL